ncbi:hypothetical protein GGR26_000595 [Lewinella marina]|uniref:Uncharacterized protein n=1 Tax=Neolewinella marina TaxID=438751 RepID=A0A2G0CJ48_9BACT|nr:hypothetical protein [Neolewinella marina]NJB84850.1 hypothetical protein [Neolewinella marina]PHK99994.1 hypothetical protein CGL56_02825 [Neolewinella marina]
MQLYTSRFFLVLASLLLSATALLGQAEGESPYSSSTVDAPPGDNFFNTYGVVIVTGVIFFGLILFLAFRGRRRAA